MSLSDLVTECGNRLLEHLPVRRGMSDAQLAFGADQRELESPPAILRRALLDRQHAPRRLRPLGFALLKFDVLALESSCHSLLVYARAMHSAHDLLTRWPALDVAAKRARLLDSFRFFPGIDADLLETVRAHKAAAARAAAGLWAQDPGVWSGDASVQRKIANRLGWLTSPALMADAIPRLERFAASISTDRFGDVVLLGMGGSSLAPEVLRAVLGVAPGRPRFHMLDSTDPAAVRAVATDPARTLYILASKSGTTIEPSSLAAHFRRLLEARVARWSEHFIAITDEGTELAQHARQESFRDLFVNPSDIGGRYSALSYFGLVPAALMGQNVSALVGWALAMLSAAEPDERDVATNPAAALGLTMGAAALAGRDKLTLLLPEAIGAMGLWIEQLVAESTGKAGTGVIPIAGERAGEPAAYGQDRLFVGVRRAESDGSDRAAAGLKSAGLPVAEIEWSDPAALGAEFVRWEVATAVAGALLGVNPFDEPNVQQAKDATNKLLASYVSSGALAPPPGATTIADRVEMAISAAARAGLAGRPPEAFLEVVGKGDYVGLLAFVGPDPELAAVLDRFRVAVGDRTHAATMSGYGPRYLHSTGQLHKGGPNSGVFVLISAKPSQDLDIPGRPFTFGTLELAQALGDFASLDATGRRALHLHLPSPDPHLLARATQALLARLPEPSAGAV
jgi:glucose-6-phosphate isomerase